MIDYAKLYHLLFNGITDAIHCLENQNYGFAMECLVVMQQKVEEIFIATDENSVETDEIATVTEESK
jgi:hypothetical protein